MNVLHADDSKVFSRLLLNVVLPALLIQILWTTKLEWDLIYFPLASLVILVALLVLGFLFAHLLGLKDKTKNAFVTAFPTIDAGNVGYPFMFLLFGTVGLSRIVLLDIMNVLFLFLIVYPLAYGLGKGKVTLRDSIQKIVSVPIVWGIVLGILLNIVGFQNELVSNTLGTISEALLLIVMMFLGVEFNPKLSSFKLPVSTILLKTVVGVTLGLVVSHIFGFQGVDRIATVIWASLPASLICIIFAKENKLDTEFTSNMLSIALPLAIVFMTIIVQFL